MPVKNQHNFQGLIADTMEMPAVKAPNDNVRPTKPAKRPKSRRHPIVWAALAVIGSFLLGLALRMAINIPSILANLTPVVPGLNAIASPQPVELGTDISTELGKKITVSMQVEQVLPFRMQGDRPRLTVFGGYLLTADGTADKKRPVMAVFTTSELDATVNAKEIYAITGYVAMANGTEQTAASILKPDQENDLTYIVSRVNYWDRVTILGTDVGTPY